MRQIYSMLLLFILSFIITFSAKAQDDTHEKIIEGLNSPSLNRVIDEIKNYRHANGAAMDYESYVTLIEQEKLKGVEFYPAYMELIKHQNPIINKEQLIELYKAKIESISIFYCEYSSELKEKGQLLFKENRFAIDGGKIFSELNTGTEKDEMILQKRISFDGGIWRFTQSDPMEPNKYFAVISKESKMKTIYAETDFLKYCFLRDSYNNQKTLPYYDLMSLLNKDHVLIQEKIITENGNRYLLVSDGKYELYLDTEKDFTVEKVVSKRYSFDKQGLLSGTGEITYTRIHSDFVDCGNGIWIPRKIEEKNFSYEKEEKILVTDYRVNQPVDDRLFIEGIFEQGTYVKDTVNNLGYVVGYPTAIEKVLDKMLLSEEIIPSKNSIQAKSKDLTEQPEKIIQKTETTTVPSKQAVAEITKTKKKQHDLYRSIATGISILGLVAFSCVIIVLKKKGKKSA